MALRCRITYWRTVQYGTCFFQQKENTPDFAGIRTSLLIALLDSVATFLVMDLGILLIALSLRVLIFLTTVNCLRALVRGGKEKGITTEVAVLLTFQFEYSKWATRERSSSS